MLFEEQLRTCNNDNESAQSPFNHRLLLVIGTLLQFV